MRVLIGTTNPAKQKVFQELLRGYDVQLVSLVDLGIEDEPDENGRNPADNAAIKAAFYGRYADYVICNDAGLYLDGLDLDDPRQPGLHIRTPNGKRLDDEEMIAHYSRLMHELGGRVQAYYLNGFAVRTPAGVKRYLEKREDALKEAFWMLDTPVEARRPGWPLDSLSVRKDGTSFIEKQKPERNPYAEQRLERWKRFLAAALDLKPLEEA